MAIQTQQTAQQSENNAIPVGKNLLSKLRSVLSQNKADIDRLASDRDILNFVVAQMGQAMMGHYVYFVGTLDPNTYRWFDSEQAKIVQGTEEIVDKRRFVEACIIGYIGGPAALNKMCRGSKLIRPRVLTETEKAAIAQKAAEIADTKDTESTFVPGTGEM